MSRTLLYRDFVLLWSGHSLSQLGSQVTLLAMPLVAVLTLGADATAVGVVTAAEFAGFLLVGLPAGAWCDRWRRRPVMVAADAVRCAALVWVPIAAVLGVLTIAQLVAVAFVQGVAAVFFDVASHSYLPGLVNADDLVAANARLSASESVARTVGPTLGGALVHLLTAPVALVVDAASFLVSAVCIGAIRRREPRLPPPPHPHLGREMVEGLRLVLGHPTLRAIAAATAVLNLAAAALATVIIIFLAGPLHLSPAAIGGLMSAGSIGGIAGAAAAPAIARRAGPVRAVWLPLTAGIPLGLLVPLAQPGAALIAFVVGWFGYSFGVVAYNVAQVSLRQSICPPRLLGRLNATIRFLTWGIMPLGALAGGVLGDRYGLRTTLWVTQAVQLIAPAVLLLSARRARLAHATGTIGATSSAIR